MQHADRKPVESMQGLFHGFAGNGKGIVGFLSAKSTPICISSLIKPLSKPPSPSTLLLRVWGEGAVSIHHFHYCFIVKSVEALIVIRGCNKLNLLRAPVGEGREEGEEEVPASSAKEPAIQDRGSQGSGCTF